MTIEVKRGRGRPKGSLNIKKALSAYAPVIPLDGISEVKRGRGRPKGSLGKVAFTNKSVPSYRPLNTLSKLPVANRVFRVIVEEEPSLIVSESSPDGFIVSISAPNEIDATQFLELNGCKVVSVK